MRRSLRRLISTSASIFVVATMSGFSSSAQDERDLSVDQRPYVHLAPSEPSELRIDADVDHSSRIYRIGQTLELSVRTNQSAYITVLDIGTSGRATVIFPNKASRDNYVTGGRTFVLPDSGSWTIGVHGPTGVEMIEVFASTSSKPIFHGRTVQGDVYETLDEAPAEAARDLEVVLNTDHKKLWNEVTQYIRIRY